MDDMTSTTFEQEQTSDGFMEGWGEPEATAADQPEQKAAEESAKDVVEAEEPAEDGASAQDSTHVEDSDAKEQETEQQADAPKVWSLRHMDEVKSVGEAEMVSLAQKGMDYDRIRSKYDESKPVMELFGQFAKDAHMSIPEYLSYIRTQAKQAGGMSEEEAKRTVSLEDREAAVAAKEAEEAERASADTKAAEAKQAAQNRRQADIEEFQKTFPDAAKDPNSIPPDVWADVRGGMSLVAAYSKYAVAQAKAAQAAAEQKAEAVAQNQTNAARSAGSMVSAGEPVSAKDPFMDGFGA